LRQTGHQHRVDGLHIDGLRHGAADTHILKRVHIGGFFGKAQAEAVRNVVLAVILMIPCRRPKLPADL